MLIKAQWDFGKIYLSSEHDHPRAEAITHTSTSTLYAIDQKAKTTIQPKNIEICNESWLSRCQNNNDSLYSHNKLLYLTKKVQKLVKTLFYLSKNPLKKAHTLYYGCLLKWSCDDIGMQTHCRLRLP